MWVVFRPITKDFFLSFDLFRRENLLRWIQRVVGLPGQRVEGGGRGGDQEGCQAQGRREHVGHSRRKSSGIDCNSGEDPIRLKTSDPTLNRNEKKIIIY